MNDEAYFLPWAKIIWQGNGTPYSQHFDDIYWSLDNSRGVGFAEKQYVFIDANQLKQRWRGLAPGDDFTILEAGFGFGLNFLLAAELWQSTGNCQNAMLHYVAFEQYPVSPDDLTKLNSRISHRFMDTLIDKYPLPIPGEHHLWIRDNICLTLILGEINKSLTNFHAEIDACFLDGFSPSRNDSMWTDDVLQNIHRMSRPGATVSSYSVAGVVRRGLSRSGFKPVKAPGFGGKAEMLQATKPGVWKAKHDRPENVCIIGAGLAGLFCAQALQRRGISFKLFESSNRPLGTVADINQLAIYPQLALAPDASSLLSLRAFLYATRHVGYHRSGRIQLLTREDKSEAVQLSNAQRLAEICPRGLLEVVSRTDATSLANLKIDHHGIYCAAAGWIDPAQILASIHQEYDEAVDAPLFHFNTHVSAFKKDGEQWVLYQGDREIARTGILILATGTADQSYLQPFKLTPVRGQSLKLLSQSSASKVILSGGVTLFPNNNGSSTLSATYSRQNPKPQISSSDTQSLFEDLKKFVDFEYHDYEAAVGFRSTTRDRMPIIGQVPDWDALDAHCAMPERSRHQLRFATFEQGLYCAAGFGSHGATLAPLCAENLIRSIGNEPGIQQPELTTTRFALRDAGVRPV
jgi:tRNA 5-methylaminomethyl-2-thiouridine biosynthesis bifunctional protein